MQLCTHHWSWWWCSTTAVEIPDSEILLLTKFINNKKILRKLFSIAFVTNTSHWKIFRIKFIDLNEICISFFFFYRDPFLRILISHTQIGVKQSLQWAEKSKWNSQDTFWCGTLKLFVVWNGLIFLYMIHFSHLLPTILHSFFFEVFLSCFLLSLSLYHFTSFFSNFFPFL